MTPEELRAARKDLACTAKELAAVLGLPQATLLAWESGELFPTRQYIDKIQVLRSKGPSAIPRKSKGQDPIKNLADPQAWELFRKLLAHKKLRDEVTKMAASYTDPAQE
jgi:transcriptional regulator with XRE-family HTH domain